MVDIVLRLLGLLVLLIPLLTCLWAFWRKRWASAPSSECLLAAAICVPLVLVVEIVVLGSFPYGRPLRLLPMLQWFVFGVTAFATWRQRATLRQALRQAHAGLADAWRTAPWPNRAALAVGLGTLLSAMAFGAWSTPWTWDELSYHVPQAVQPYQDGRIGPVQANLIAADSYPRAVELLYYWTLELTHTDAGFHPVNASFGFIFFLATYVAAMRLGLDRAWAWLAAGIVPTTPLFWYMGTIGYIDLSVTSAVAACMAMALPHRDGSWSWGSCICMLLAGILAMWMKFTPIAVLGFTGACRGLLTVGQWWLAVRRGDRPLPRPGPLSLAGVMLLALGLASIPYVRAWAKYGSPAYPLGLRIGSHVIFDGPIEVKNVAHMYSQPLLQRYSAYWCGWWYTPITPDSQGSLGPLFVLAMLGAVIVCSFAELRLRRPGWLLVIGSFWLFVALPQYHLIRYSLYILLPAAVCTARLGQALVASELASSWSMGVLLLASLNLHVLGTQVYEGLRWQASMGIPLLTRARNRPVVDKVHHIGPTTPTPETRRVLYRIVDNRETLVTAVDGLFALFYDGKYRYRVEHRPARPWPVKYGPGSDLTFGAAEAPAWLASLLRDQVQVVLVYANSAEDCALRAAGSGYRLVYEQAPEPAGNGFRIYRRTVE